MKEHILRPHIFQKWVRVVILLLIISFFFLGIFELKGMVDRGFSPKFELGEWRFVFPFILVAFMILVYFDQENKARYYIKWDNHFIYYKLDSGPEERIDLNTIEHIKANYSKVFIYMKDGSKKLVNFYSLDPRFKDVQEIISINDLLKFRNRWAKHL